MSTETLTAPVESKPEIVIETPEITTPTEKSTPLWQQIKVGNQPETPKEAPEAKEPEKAAPEVQKTPESAPKSGKEESLANLRKKLEDQTKELEDYRAKYSTVEKEYNEYKSKPIEVPEEFKTKLSTLEQERETFSKELMAAKLERHPDFQRKYQKNIEGQVQLMTKIAIESGIDENEVRQGMGSWNEDTFGAWAEQMGPGARTKFSAAWIKSEELWNERTQAIQNAEKTWTDMQREYEAKSKADYDSQLSNNEKLAKSLVKELILDNEGYKEFEDLPAAAEAMAMKAARYELTPKEVFQNVIAGQALAKINVKLNDTVKAKDETIAELTKKLSDAEAFIKDQAGSTPSPSAGGVITKGGTAEKRPIWDQIVIAPR